MAATEGGIKSRPGRSWQVAVGDGPAEATLLFRPANAVTLLRRQNQRNLFSFAVASTWDVEDDDETRGPGAPAGDVVA